MGRADIVALLLQVPRHAPQYSDMRISLITRSQGGASVAAAVEVSDSMVFLRCSVCANVLPASDDLSENRFCSRCRTVTHMPKIDAAAWDYAGVTPLHAALTREAPAEVALQASASRRVLLPAPDTRPQLLRHGADPDHVRGGAARGADGRDVAVLVAQAQRRGPRGQGGV
jgi:hypothetical protein